MKKIFKKIKPYLWVAEMNLAVIVFFLIATLIDTLIVGTVFFVHDPMSFITPARAEWNITVPKTEKTYKEITNEHKQGHRYLTAAEKQWVLNETAKAGFSNSDIKCLIEHESSWDEEGKLINNGKSLSVDRGLFAINDYWHKEVSNKCAYDYKCATKEFIRIAKENKSFNAWIGYVNNCL